MAAMTGYAIEDELRAYTYAAYAAEDQAVDALCRLATVPWGSGAQRASIWRRAGGVRAAVP